MADSSSGILRWGVLGVGAFWLWKVYSSGGAGFSLSDLMGAASANPAAVPQAPAAAQPVPAGQPVASSPAAASAPPPGVGPAPAGAASNPASALAGELLAAAAGDSFLVNGAFNADHWAFYYNLVRTPLTPAQFGAAFPNITGTDRGPDITAAQFVQALQSAGLVGAGSLAGLGAVYIPVPVRRGPGLVWPTRTLKPKNEPVAFLHRFPWGHLPIVGAR